MDGTIVISTGAGISAESGLKTFRDNNGLWENHRVEDVATPEAFARNPDLVHRFYNLRRAQLKEVKPNAAHLALARLEREWPGEVFLATQNVDDLHQRAGSENMVSIHGELKKGKCTKCYSTFDWVDDMSVESLCPECRQDHCVRPDIVWFGEQPYFMDVVFEKLDDCDLFIAIGTSGNVYPAAAFVQQAKGAKKVEINLQASLVASDFDEVIEGPATVQVPEFVARLLSGKYKF